VEALRDREQFMAMAIRTSRNNHRLFHSYVLDLVGGSKH
jgi:hypothetical protein